MGENYHIDSACGSETVVCNPLPLPNGSRLIVIYKLQARIASFTSVDSWYPFDPQGIQILIQPIATITAGDHGIELVVLEYSHSEKLAEFL